jgi:hypothetical protein
MGEEEKDYPRNMTEWIQFLISQQSHSFTLIAGFIAYTSITTVLLIWYIDNANFTGSILAFGLGILAVCGIVYLTYPNSYLIRARILLRKILKGELTNPKEVCAEWFKKEKSDLKINLLSGGINMPINNEGRMDKQKEQLDRLLLSATSLLGIFFGITQSILDKIDALTFFILLLILIWIVPIYIGYIRGTIIYNNIVERFRGWVYFLGGTLIYILFSSVYYLKRPIMNLSTLDYFLVIILIFGIFYFIVFLSKKFFKFFNHETSKAENIILRRTYTNLLLIGVAFIFYLLAANILREDQNALGSVPVYVAIFFMLFMILLSVNSERLNNKILGKTIKTTPKKLWKNTPAILSGISFLIDIGALCVIISFFPQLIIPYLHLIIILLYVSLALFYLFIFYSSIENFKIEIID